MARSGQDGRGTDTGSPMQVFGEVAWLAARSALHRDGAINELDRLVSPALALGQLRLWRRGARPVAFATWAWLGRDAAAGYLASGALAPADWRSGSELWFVDVVTPFGDGFAVGADLLRMIPPNAIAFGARRAPDGSLRRLVRYVPRRGGDAVGRGGGRAPTASAPAHDLAAGMVPAAHTGNFTHG